MLAWPLLLPEMIDMKFPCRAQTQIDAQMKIQTSQTNPHLNVTEVEELLMLRVKKKIPLL